jgi:hypothetical protein
VSSTDDKKTGGLHTQNIQSVDSLHKFICRLLCILRFREVEIMVNDPTFHALTKLVFYPPDARRRLLFVARGNVHCGTKLRECLRSLEPEARSSERSRQDCCVVRRLEKRKIVHRANDECYFPIWLHVRKCLVDVQTHDNLNEHGDAERSYTSNPERQRNNERRCACEDLYS